MPPNDDDQKRFQLQPVGTAMPQLRSSRVTGSMSNSSQHWLSYGIASINTDTTYEYCNWYW